MKRKLISLVSLFLSCIIGTSCIGCVSEAKSNDLMDGYEKRAKDAINEGSFELPDADNSTMTEFSVKLFKESFEAEKNTLISPLSVISALAMTAGGADGNTLSQMEQVFGMDKDTLDGYISSYVGGLPQGDKYKLNLANSIWLRDSSSFSPNGDFLQHNADYYGADIYEAPFDDSTVKEINSWVSDNTDGMIDSIIDRISADTIMYLINALAFDAEWEEIYEKYDVRDGDFTKEDGSKISVDFMYSTEGAYIADELAAGFIKYYAGRKYAFVALLPNEGVSVEEYISSLNGEKLNRMLTSPESATVWASIPKFETKYSVEMSDILSTLGMPDAFDSTLADFSGMGTADGNIYINRVIHKTFISVGEKGTRAGAATVVEMNCTSAAPIVEPKEVYLDRPFVYMLIDCENNVPFFIGAMMDPSK